MEQANFSLLGYLIADADADIHIQTFAGDTPLHLACSLDYVAVAAVLVSAGAEPSIENFDTSSNEMAGETGVISDEGHVEIFEDEYNNEILSGKTSVDLACSERVRTLSTFSEMSKLVLSTCCIIVNTIQCHYLY